MSKNFRHHTTGSNVEHWTNVDAYGQREISAMPDPAGMRTGKPITSIPSPFARLDLIKTAFDYVAHHDTTDPGYLEGERDPATGQRRPNDYHRLVSDALDLAQLLFEYDAVRGNLTLSFWDRSQHLRQLKDNAMWPGLRLLGETLDLFLERDSKTNNFADAMRLYIIKYDHKVIGATSPKTLFFTSANDLSFVDVTFPDGHRAFRDVRSLHQRDPEFVEFFFHFFRAHGLAGHMSEVNNYLVRTKEKLPKPLVDALNKQQAGQFASAYDTIPLTGGRVEILNAEFRKKLVDPGNVSAASDFVIDSPKYRRLAEADATADPRPSVVRQMPLALFGARKPLQYTASAKWDVNEKVPAYDAKPLHQRRLPGVSMEYPYLTVSDFLEPHLIQTVFPIDKRHWFDGNLTVESGSEKQGYLLPLTERFFEFFDAGDLLGRTSDGKPFFELTQIARGGVRATLRVPIKKEREYVEFTRLYEPSAANEITPPDPERNKGIILTNQFSLTLFPFLKPVESQPGDAGQDFLPNVYRVQLIEQDFDPRFVQNHYKLQFFRNDFSVKVAATGRTRTPLVVGRAGTHYYKVDDGFDLILVQTQHARAFILPRWKARPGGNLRYRFAIDFGTTNSHVEYTVDGSGGPRPFEVTKDEELQIATLFDDAATSSDFGGSGANLLRDKVVREFLPARIGGSAEYRFPLRTIMQEGKQVNFTSGADALMELNLGFVYDRNFEETQDSRFHPNLKWSNPADAGNPQRVQAFFDEVMLLLRNKVLLGGGTLRQTELVWFYPASMKPAQLGSIRGFVQSAFRKYIGAGADNIRELSESVAPFYYYTNTGGTTSGLNVTASNRPAVSVDIGGGTTDVVIFQEIWQKGPDGIPVSDLRPRLTTSFRFAGNALFGTGFVPNGSATSNGFVRKYATHFTKSLAADPRLGVPAQLLETRLNDSSAEEVNNFLFTLEANPEVRRALNNPGLLSYNALLAQDADLKLLFLYFYAALVYHVAGMMKQRGQKMPGYVLFSGTASKVIEILSGDDYAITDLTRRIFERMYGETYADNEHFEVRREKNRPKELTCKGGLLMTGHQLNQLSGGNARQLQQRMQEINRVFAGIETKGAATPTPGEILEEAALDEVVKSVETFHAFLLDLHLDFDFTDHLGVSKDALRVFRSEANLGLKESLMAGLSQRLSREESAKLEESPFFYPITANLVRLSLRLATLAPVAQP